jgi:hypothetical protein
VPHPNLAFLERMATYENIFGPLPPDSAAIELLGHLPQRFTLQNLSALAILADRLTLDPQSQLSILSMFDHGNPNINLELVKQMLRDGGAEVFIHPSQIAATAALVCRYGADVSDERFNLDEFIIVLALVNSFVGGEPSSPTLTGVQRLMLTEVRSVTARANLMDVAYRYYQLMEWVPTNRAPNLPNELREELRLALGLTYNEYAASMLGVASVGSQLVVNRPKHLERVPVNLPLLVSTIETKDALEQYATINSLSTSSVAQLLSDGSLSDQAQRWRKSFLVSPLIQSAHDELCFAFFPALAETLGRGLFSRLLTHFNETYGRSTGDAFLDYFGRFLEDYVATILSRSGMRVITDLPFATKFSTNNRIVDAVIVEGRSLVFIEVAAKRFNLSETIINGSLASLDLDLEQMVVGKARQLASSIEVFRKGRLDMVPITPARVKRIYPVLVLQEFPQFAAVRRHAFALMQNAGVRLEDLQIITVDEIEMIEGLLSRGYRLSDLLKAKLRSPSASEMSLTNYILTKKKNLSLTKSSTVEKAETDWFRERMMQFQEWGLKVDLSSLPRVD